MQAQNNKSNNTNEPLPPIPQKRYFTIGEVSELCAVKAHVLRYWEQEFKQLAPLKRRGNRRYYHYRDVLLVREIRSFLYDQGFTIQGCKQKLSQEKTRSNVNRDLQKLVKDSISQLEEIKEILQ